jgi:hypothetical protein
MYLIADHQAVGATVIAIRSNHETTEETIVGWTVIVAAASVRRKTCAILVD